MQILARLTILCTLIFGINLAFAGSCGDCQQNKKPKPKCEKCCDGMGGVQYCDSSAGRLVCNNGFYSSCYCTRHAVMDLDHLQGCCLWQGGVMTTDDATGLVICNDGGISPVCSMEEPPQSVASW